MVRCNNGMVRCNKEEAMAEEKTKKYLITFWDDVSEVDAVHVFPSKEKAVSGAMEAAILFPEEEVTMWEATEITVFNSKKETQS